MKVPMHSKKVVSCKSRTKLLFYAKSSSVPAKINNPTNVVMAKLPTNKKTTLSPPVLLINLYYIIMTNFRETVIFLTSIHKNCEQISNYSFSIVFSTISVECLAAIGKNSSKLKFDCFPAISDNARITTNGFSN